MSVLTRFQLTDDEARKRAVAQLVKQSTEDFDFYLFLVLAVLMATFGLLLDSAAVVIGSMLIAPILSPILSFALSFVVADVQLFLRSGGALLRASAFAIVLSWLATIVFRDQFMAPTAQVLLRTEPSLMYFFVAFIAGIAVAYALAQREANTTFPGIAVSVALLPPLAATGVGVAFADANIVAGAFSLFFINVVGILLAAVVMFSLMRFQQEHRIAMSAIKQEERRIEEEHEKLEEIVEQEGEGSSEGV